MHHSDQTLPVNPEDITHIHISLQFRNDQKMDLQEAAVHLRLLNFIRMFNTQKEQRNQEASRDSSPTEVVLPYNSELFLLPKKSVCLASFFYEIRFLHQFSSLPSPLHVLLANNTSLLAKTERLEGNYISLGLEKANCPWEAQVSSLIQPQ